MQPRLLKPEEAALVLALSRSKVYELMRSGRLHTIKIDGSRRVPVEAVDDFIARAREDAA
jgi:excisionase family DNA binding protein